MALIGLVFGVPVGIATTIVGGSNMLVERISIDGLVAVTSLEVGRPIQVQIEEVHILQGGSDASTRRIHERLYIDREGRGRHERTREMLDKAIRVADILDPVARLSFEIDLDSGAVLRHRVLGARRGSTRDAGSAAGEPNPEILPSPIARSRADLGVREIESFACYGRGEVLPDGVKIEYWFSPDVGLPLLEKKVSAHEEVTRRLFDIQLVDPDPELFVEPKTR
jgi:hypothetical protein